MRFFGTIEAKTDSKGRAFLPAVFRKVLEATGEENLVMRKDIHESCLTLYPESVWNEYLDKLSSRLNRWSAEHRRVFRQFVSDVEIVTLDPNGRFLIPKRYLKMADIDQAIKFKGMGDTIEIWSVQQEEQAQMSSEEFSQALELLMDDNSEQE